MIRYTSRDGSGGIDVRDVNKAVERLAEYEDTQLEPREIVRLQVHAALEDYYRDKRRSGIL